MEYTTGETFHQAQWYTTTTENGSTTGYGKIKPYTAWSIR